MELTDSAIKEFLETAPLYEWREYERPKVNRASIWIRAIDALCEVCDQVRPFHDLRPSGGGMGMKIKPFASGTSYLEFTCVTCRRSRREFLVEQIVGQETVKLQKYGELPRKALPRDQRLQKFLKEDLEHYEKGLVCLTNSYGIAAYAYFRRVVENNILRLIQLIEEDATSSAAEPEVVQALNELRHDSPMSDKIAVANKALPAYLMPDGINPLGRMYQSLSEGIHSKSDEECLKNAKALLGCLSYLLSELAERKSHREAFKRNVGGL